MADYKSGNDGSKFNPLDYPQCLEFPQRASTLAWHEHIPFIKILIQLLRPKSLVKLGVSDDDSYLAVCEAAAALGIACYGVDTRGDKKSVTHVEVADDQILRALHTKHDSQFGSFSNLIKSSGDEAATHFSDSSIDLLYIDGQKSYEEICRDWDAWRPKLSRSGVVMFQGTNVREGETGMWRLWKELRTVYRHFEFLHGRGLGVIIASPGVPEALNVFLAMTDKNPETIRKYFYALGSQSSLRAQVEVQTAELKALDEKLKDSENKRAVLEATISGLNIKIDGFDETLNFAKQAAAFDAQKIHDELAISAASNAELRSQIAELQKDLSAQKAETARATGTKFYRLGQWLSAPFGLFAKK